MKLTWPATWFTISSHYTLILSMCSVVLSVLAFLFLWLMDNSTVVSRKAEDAYHTGAWVRVVHLFQMVLFSTYFMVFLVISCFCYVGAFSLFGFSLDLILLSLTTFIILILLINISILDTLFSLILELVR